MGALFTVDCEDWNHGLHIEANGHSSIASLWWLQYKLAQWNVRAIFFVLKKFSDEHPGMIGSLKNNGHIIKSHGYNHYRWEKADRKPYSWLGFTGGFWFRWFPYWLIKWNVIRNGHFYVHPHDLDEEHPKLSNPIMDWKRHVGLKQARNKLERLLREVSWHEPSED